MKIGVRKSFRDKEEKVLRKPGDIVEVSEERGAFLIQNGYATAMQEGKTEEEQHGEEQEEDKEEPGEEKDGDIIEVSEETAEMPKKKYGKRGSNHN